MAKLHSAEVELSFWGLLQSRMSFSKLGLDGLELFLKKRGKEWNIQGLMRADSANSSNESFDHLPVVGKDPVKNLFIDELEIANSTIHIDQAPDLSLSMVGSLAYPEVHVSQLRLHSKNSRLVSKLDYQINESQGNLQILNSNLSLKEIPPFWFFAHEASGNVQVQGVLKWNRERWVPDLRWTSQDLQIQHKSLDAKFTKVDGQWNETGFYFMSPMSTSQGDAWASLLLNTSVEDILLGERFKGRLVLKNLTAPKFPAPFEMNADFSYSHKVIDFQRASISSLGNDLLQAEGRYSFNSDKLSFSFEGGLEDLSQVYPWGKGEITLEGKGTWTQFDGLEFSVENQGRNLSVLNRPSPDLRVEIQGGWQDGSLNLPLFRVQTSQGGNLLFQGLLDFKRSQTDLAQGHFRINTLELNPFLPKGWPVDSPPLVLSECKGKITGPEIRFKKLRGRLGQGTFSYEGNIYPYAGLSNLFQGKLNMQQIPLQWAHRWIPETAEIGGIWKSDGPYQMEVNTKQETKLKLSGVLNPAKLSAMEQINILGTLDLKDLSELSGFSPANLEGVLRVGVSQIDETRLRGGIYASKIDLQLPKPYPKLSPRNLELEFNIHKNPFLMRLKKFTGEVFSGRFSARGVSELEGRFLNQGSIELSSLNLEELWPLLEPALQGRFKAALGAQLSFLSILAPVSGNIPLVLDGALSLDKPLFHAPASIQAMTRSIKSSIVRGYFKAISRQMPTRAHIKTMPIELHPVSEISFNLSHGALQFPEINLVDKQNRFQIINTTPIQLSLGTSPGHRTALQGDLALDMGNAFLRSEFPYLKEDFKENLKTGLKISGPLGDPVQEADLQAFHRKLVQGLLRVSDLKKIQISKTAELENLKGNLLGERERETAKARGREYLLQMLSPKGQTRVRNRIGRVTSSSTPLSMEENYTDAGEVAKIEHQLQVAREKLESVLGEKWE